MKRTISLGILLLAAALICFAPFSGALPTGASIVSNTTAGLPTYTAGNLTQDRGTITTIILSATQQDQNWKAYVGNITGKLTLDNAGGQTIYEWPIPLSDKKGEVYITRSGSPDFTNVSCANDVNISTEEYFHNMTLAQGDNIRNTFNLTNHYGFYVGTTYINNNSCNSTATFVNDVAQAVTGAQRFQEVVIQDGLFNTLFVTLLSSSTGYNGDVYDFQIIVPESAIKSTPTTYYFYTQLQS